MIVGHSERRIDHGETDAMVHEKARGAWRAGLTAIICVGETHDNTPPAMTMDVLSARSPVRFLPRTARNTVIAYEPVWAIGTGLTPTPPTWPKRMPTSARRTCTSVGAEARPMRILYGGSVKPYNAVELLALSPMSTARWSAAPA